MNQDGIERWAREAGVSPWMIGDGETRTASTKGRLATLERFAALVRADALEGAIAIIQAELDHAAINDHRMPAGFGKSVGVPAVRAANVEAALDAIRKLIQSPLIRAPE